MRAINLTGILISTSFIIGAMVLSTKFLWIYLDTPSILFVLALTFGSLLGKYGSKGVKFWRSPEIAAFGGKAARNAGILGSILGAITILDNISNPAHLAPAIGVASLTLFYGYTLYFLLFIPFEKQQPCLQK